MQQLNLHKSNLIIQSTICKIIYSLEKTSMLYVIYFTIVFLLIFHYIRGKRIFYCLNYCQSRMHFIFIIDTENEDFLLSWLLYWGLIFLSDECKWSYFWYKRTRPLVFNFLGTINNFVMSHVLQTNLDISLGLDVLLSGDTFLQKTVPLS